MASLDAHTSQMYEWIPWTFGGVDQVPEGAAERLEWLKKLWGRPNVSDEARKSLTKWYGAKKANKVTYVETFEICEYGRQPTDDEIRVLFPMLGK